MVGHQMESYIEGIYPTSTIFNCINHKINTMQARCPYCKEETSFSAKRDVITRNVGDVPTVIPLLTAICCDKCGTVVTAVDESLSNRITALEILVKELRS